jgi:pilus assembly protein Flp/PilA
MKQWLDRASRFLRDEDGPTAVEYAVMLALIVVVCIAAIGALGTGASETFSNVALNTAAAGGSGS